MNDIVVGSGSRSIGVRLLGPDSGRPVLFFHGTPGCRLEVARLEAAAQNVGARLVAIDRPGCGRTSPTRAEHWTQRVVADVNAVLDELAIERSPLLAVSGGVAAALSAAAAVRDRVFRVGLASGLGLLTALRHREGIAPLNRGMAAVARRSVNAARVALAPPYLFSRLAAVAPGIANRDPRLGALADEMRETFRQGVEGPAIDLWNASRVERLDLAAVQQPVLAWHGTRDRHAPAAGMRALVAQLPNASLEMIEGEDHFVFESHAGAILSAIAAP